MLHTGAWAFGKVTDPNCEMRLVNLSLASQFDVISSNGIEIIAIMKYTGFRVPLVHTCQNMDDVIAFFQAKGVLKMATETRPDNAA